ncbi:monofunctional biosynthetic peptidoglycan transglycosylase [Hyphococcus sp.]|uniref:monofunctional biosynthetic peptidoglycan transglycosylase n=1 Tax=Hyphococcus sp. TaxID=2038636 RepID=UPI0035C68A16
MALTAPKRKRRKGRKKKKQKPQNRLRLILRASGFAALALVGGSVLWAGLYAIASPPGTLLMLQRKLSGDVIAHPWTPLEEISPHLVTAVIAAEDTRFCLHNGIDFEAIDKALEEKKKGKRLRGASTISQQTAKNAFFWNGGGWLRKGGEAWMTVLIESIWPKRRVMEVYLNISEWGDGNFGAEAAAQARFGKSAKDLTSYEAALLASVLPNPHKWRVDPPGPYVRSRSHTIRSRMDQVRRDGLDACVLNAR